MCILVRAQHPLYNAEFENTNQRMYAFLCQWY